MLSVLVLVQEVEIVLSILEIYDVCVVNVEVVVIDWQGNCIMGFGFEDFIFFVDGQEVDVDYFSEIWGGCVFDEGVVLVDVDLIVGGEVVGMNYFVFIDNFFIIKVDCQCVLCDMQEQFGVLQLEDCMVIVLWDGKGLMMYLSWMGFE